MTEGSLAEHATLTIRVPGPIPQDGALLGTEPCENCATRVLLGDISHAFGRELAPLARTLAGDRMLERHVVDTDPGTAIVFRAHSPERCSAARAGNPEPLDLSEEDDDDES